MSTTSQPELYYGILDISENMRLEFTVTAESVSYDEAFAQISELCFERHADILKSCSRQLQEVLKPYTLDMVQRSIKQGGLFVSKRKRPRQVVYLAIIQNDSGYAFPRVFRYFKDAKRYLINEFKDNIDFDLSIFDKCIEEDESFFYRNHALNIILQLSEEIVIEN
jgi:hypothetical protein